MNFKLIMLFLICSLTCACGVKSDPVAPAKNNYPSYDAKFVAPTPTPTPAAQE